MPGKNEKLNSQMTMFGCTQSDLDEMMNNQFDQRDRFMLVASILSDAQEIMNSSPETSRQFINRAKYVLFRLQDDLYQT